MQLAPLHTMLIKHLLSWPAWKKSVYASPKQMTHPFLHHPWWMTRTSQLQWSTFWWNCNWPISNTGGHWPGLLVTPPKSKVASGIWKSWIVTLTWPNHHTTRVGRRPKNAQHLAYQAPILDTIKLALTMQWSVQSTRHYQSYHSKLDTLITGGKRGLMWC